MKKNLKRTLAKVMAVALTVSLLGTAADADAAKKKKPKLAKKTVTVTKGKSKKVKIKNVKAKQVKKITVKQTKKTKKIAKVTKSGKTAVKVKGIKKGTAKVTINVTLKGKKKATKLRLKVKVQNPKKPKPTAAPSAAPTTPATAAPTTPVATAPATPVATPQVYGLSDPYKITISDENESATTNIAKRKANGMSDEEAAAYNTNTVYNSDGSVTFTSASQWDGGVQYYINPDYTTTEEDGKTIYNVTAADLTKYKGVRFVVKDAFVETSMKIVTNANNYADADGTHKVEKYEGTANLTDKNGDPVGDRTITYSFAGIAEKDLKEAYSIGLAWHNQVGAEGTIVSIELTNDVEAEPEKPAEPAKDEITLADTDQVYKFDKDNEVTVENAAWKTGEIDIAGKEIEVKSNDSVYVKARALDSAGKEIIADLAAMISCDKDDAWNNRVFFSGENPAKAGEYKWTGTGAYQGLFKAGKGSVKSAAAQAFAEDTTGKEKVKFTKVYFQPTKTYGEDENLKIVLDEIVVRPGKNPEDNPGGSEEAEYKVAITAETSSIEKGETTTVEVAVVDKNGVETTATEIENVTWASTDTAKVEVESNSVDKTKVTVTGVETGSAEVVASVKTKDGKTTAVKVKITVRGVGEAVPPASDDDDKNPGEEDKNKSTVKTFDELAGNFTFTTAAEAYSGQKIFAFSNDVEINPTDTVTAEIEFLDKDGKKIDAPNFQASLVTDTNSWGSSKALDSTSVTGEKVTFYTGTRNYNQSESKWEETPMSAKTAVKGIVFQNTAALEENSGIQVVFKSITITPAGESAQVKTFDELAGNFTFTTAAAAYSGQKIFVFSNDVEINPTDTVTAEIEFLDKDGKKIDAPNFQASLVTDTNSWGSSKALDSTSVTGEKVTFYTGTRNYNQSESKWEETPMSAKTAVKGIVFQNTAALEENSGIQVVFKSITITPAADTEA